MRKLALDNFETPLEYSRVNNDLEVFTPDPSQEKIDTVTSKKRDLDQGDDWFAE